MRCYAVLPPFIATSPWTVRMCRDTMETVRCALLMPSVQNKYSRAGRYNNGWHLVKGPEKTVVKQGSDDHLLLPKTLLHFSHWRMFKETVRYEEVKYQCVAQNSARIRMSRTCSTGQCLGYRGGRLTDEEVSVAPSLIEGFQQSVYRSRVGLSH